MTKTLLLFLSDQARSDLIDIWQYIALDSITAADKFIDLIYEKCKGIGTYPEIGRRRDELIPGLRSFPVKKYIVYYRVMEDKVEVARVLSAYRDQTALF
jgi:toxin ParE1/3/4